MTSKKEYIDQTLNLLKDKENYLNDFVKLKEDRDELLQCLITMSNCKIREAEETEWGTSRRHIEITYNLETSVYERMKKLLKKDRKMLEFKEPDKPEKQSKYNFISKE